MRRRSRARASASGSQWRGRKRLTRPFAWGDRNAAGALYIQVFNLLGRFNGGPIEGRVISPDFGRPIGQAGPPRTIEAGLKIGF